MTKGQQTRREIIEKAAPLFNKKGYEGTSLSDLMDVTGLQKGGIYRHFDNKEELAAAAFDYSWLKAANGRLDGVDDSADSVDRLKKMISNFVERPPVYPKSSAKVSHIIRSTLRFIRKNFPNSSSLLSKALSSSAAYKKIATLFTMSASTSTNIWNKTYAPKPAASNSLRSHAPFSALARL